MTFKRSLVANLFSVGAIAVLIPDLPFWRFAVGNMLLGFAIRIYNGDFA